MFNIRRGIDANHGTLTVDTNPPAVRSLSFLEFEWRHGGTEAPGKTRRRQSGVEASRLNP